MSIIRISPDRFRRPSRRAVAIIVLILLVIGAVVVTATYWVVQRNASQAEPEMTNAEYVERSREYLGARDVVGGTFQSFSESDQTVSINTDQGIKTYTYDKKTGFGKGIEYTDIDPREIPIGATVSVTVVQEEYAEVVWLPE